MNKNNNVNELLEKYMKQTNKAQKKEYDDEIRAEADLCAECCHCLRVCCIMGSH